MLLYELLFREWKLQQDMMCAYVYEDDGYVCFIAQLFGLRPQIPFA